MGKSQHGVVPGLEAFTLEDPSITRLASQIDDPFPPSGALHAAAIFHLLKLASPPMYVYRFKLSCQENMGGSSR